MLERTMVKWLMAPNERAWSAYSGESRWREYSKNLFGFRAFKCYFHFTAKIRVYGKGDDIAITYAGKSGMSGSSEVFPFRIGYLHMSICIPYPMANKFKWLKP